MHLQKRDYSLDFAKGIAILSVILLHNMPNEQIASIAWIGQAVPLFLLITGYLTYSGFENGKTLRSYFSFPAVWGMFKRIFVPFLVITVIQCFLYYFFADFSLYVVIRDAGIGPGAYYPWLYLQFWFLLPFIIRVIDRLSIAKSLVLFILICVVLEWLTCVTHLPGALYRLSCYRYLLVVVLGCLAKKASLQLTPTLVLLAAVSLLFSLVEVYGPFDMEPVFTRQWKGYHWITAFYPLFLFILIRRFYARISGTRISHFFIRLGKYSYEIFLCQMFVYSVFPLFIPLTGIENFYLQQAVYILSTTLLSILPVLIYKKRKESKAFK